MRKTIGYIALGGAMIMLLSIFSMVAFAADGKIEVTGNVYEFDKDSHYEFHESGSSSKTGTDNTYGTFYISGEISAVSEKGGVPSFEVADGNLALFYNYGDTMLNADADSWHLVEDKSKKIADVTLDSNIMKGAIILQTSKDRNNWTDVEITYNAFSDMPIRTSSFYSTTNVQLINGCYYRVIVVYEFAIRTEDNNFLFVNTDKYDYKKCAEVYEFYAYTDSGETDAVDSNHIYSLGSKVKVANFDGYFGEKTIDKEDIHYGWEIGDFFVSGYTDEVTGTNGNMVFLKNVGDRVTLWFNLKQNIDGLYGNSKLSITADTEGYDQYFETPIMDLGRGVLIIKYTDHNNVQAEPTIYTNYLEANAAIGADTKVQLFEEGDYEVALDYEVTSDELIDKIGHYRIFFRFSVRNGNCMVYPFDVETGNELTNSSMTENGFKLDLAKSRYLKINIKREVPKDSVDGLMEDIRFNGPAKDGAEYTDEGIYTITVSNEYTNQFTVKRIYVGANNILRAYMVTGLSIPEINSLVAEGATINDDGSIQLAAVTSTEEHTKVFSPEETKTLKPSEEVQTSNSDISRIEESGQKTLPIVAFIGIAVCIVIAVVLVLKKRQSIATAESHEYKGGGEQ